MDKKTPIKDPDVFTENLNAALDPFAEALMAIDFPAPPPNTLVPEKVWRENKKRELLDTLTGGPVREKVDQALPLIIDYVERTLSPSEAQRVIKEWSDGALGFIEHITKAQSGSKETEENTSLEEAMKISPQSIEYFYAAGVKLIEQNKFHEASCVFTLLTILNDQRYNVWLALGVSLQNNREFEAAIRAYDMAALLNSDAPLPYIRSADCCVMNNDKQQAVVYIERAQEALDKSVEDPDDLKKYFNQVKSAINK